MGGWFWGFGCVVCRVCCLLVMLLLCKVVAGLLMIWVVVGFELVLWLSLISCSMLSLFGGSLFDLLLGIGLLWFILC